MARRVTQNSGSFRFDQNLSWYKLGEFEHFVFAILDFDVPRKIVDFVVKFEPNQQIFLHRHLALTNTLVIQGEHRLYEPSGVIKEVRSAGYFTSSPPGEVHREGAGAEEAIVLYSVRGRDDVLLEVLGDDLSVVCTLGAYSLHHVHL
jgi:hypothetical protein